MGRRQQEERVAAELLQFLAPGLLHGMGNSLFSIQGHAQLLRGSDGEISRARTAILKGTERALKGLDVLRYVLGESDPGAAPQAGVLLTRLCEYVRIPLRERGVQVQLAQSSGEAPLGVDGTALCQVVVEVLRRIADVLPRGFEGQVVVDLLGQRAGAVVVGLGVESGASFLPFPIDLAAVIRAAGPILEHHGARVESAGDLQHLRVTVPAVAAPPHTPRDARPAGDAGGNAQLAVES